MNRNLCPLCRFSMRLWALSWRDGAHKRVNLNERVVINTAAGFRDECCHTDRDKYDALVNKLNALPLKSSPLAMALWFEIERIKNCNGGHVPSGRTFNAWRSRFEKPATHAEAA